MAKNRFQMARVATLYKQKEILFSKIKRMCITGGTDWIINCGKNSILARNNPEFLRIYDWLDLDKFKTNKNKSYICEKYKLDINKKIILGVSQSWTIEKGVETQIELGKSIGDKVSIVLVGGHDEIERSEGLNFIGYTENREEIIDLYFAADLVVNTSRMETFGLVTVEAMACGTPVVAYSNTGTTELIHPNCGWLVEDGNINKMVETVNIAIKQDLEIMKPYCLEWVKNNFDKNKQLQLYLDLYCHLVKKINT